MVNISFDLIFQFAINCIDLLICYRYMNTFFEKRRNEIWLILAGVLSVIISTYVNTYRILQLNIFWAITNVTVLSFLFRGTMKRKLLINSIFIFIGMISEPLTGMIILTVGNQDFHAVFVDSINIYTYYGMLLNEVFKVFVIALMGGYYKHKHIGFNYISARITVLFSVIPLVSSIIIYWLIRIIYKNNQSEDIKYYLVCVVILIYINILVFYILNIYVKNLNESIKKKIIARELIFKDQYYKKVEENQNEIRKIRHNIKNQQIGILELLENGRHGEAISAIEQIIEDISMVKKKVYSKNIIIDGILSSKIEENNSFIEVLVNVPETINIDVLDLSSVLGNILDNALESYNVNVSKPYIKVQIYFIKNMLYIEAENSVDSNRDKRLRTKKKDRINHGIGLRSIKEVALKYNGDVKIVSDNNIFRISVCLYLK